MKGASGTGRVPTKCIDGAVEDASARKRHTSAGTGKCTLLFAVWCDGTGVFDLRA